MSCNALTFHGWKTSFVLTSDIDYMRETNIEGDWIAVDAIRLQPCHYITLYITLRERLLRSSPSPLTSTDLPNYTLQTHNNTSCRATLGAPPSLFLPSHAVIMPRSISTLLHLICYLIYMTINAFLVVLANVLALFISRVLSGHH